MVSALDPLLDDFLAEEMEESPVRATQLGIDGHDDRLGEFTAGDYERRAQNDDRWHERLSSLSDDELTADERIDRDLVLSTLRGRQIMRDWAVWRRDPATYLGPCLSGVFGLFLNRAHPEAELVASASARLRGVPSVLDAARANLDPELASPLFIERAKGQCRAGIAYARTMVPAEVADSDLRATLAEAGEVAAGALEGFATFLDELGAVASGGWALGDETYSALLREKELLGYGAAEMRERGRRAYDELSEEMSELASRIDGSNGSRDWRAAVERLNEDHPSSPEQMRDEYDEWTERCRRFLHETQLVTMPEGEECQVLPSPPFQRPMLAVASYSPPPAFKPSLTGTFFVPFPPDGTPPEDVQKRLATNSRSSIPTISAHEAYPGHHWHLITIQQNPRPIRKVLGTSYFTEGWGLYAERIMREQGFFADPRHELAHLDARIFRAARIVVDTSLHMGEMTFEEAVTFMSTKASLSEPTARAEVGRYCSWPTQAASYLTGSIEIERIRDRYLGDHRGTLREFNDAIAGSGMLPIELAERAVLG
ncbi:MAG TPA: DUF885 domain-containing protein [Acidimicrobiales bacterium]|jgi:uncharacterized protein (DUF885 family)|nr:DUF885 domain-containing protein [Acidimicrobiales bacterium]